MQTREAPMLETAAAWEQAGIAAGEGREMMGAMDETCLEPMILVCQEVPPGYIVQEEVADERTSAPWQAVVDARLTALGTEGVPT